MLNEHTFLTNTKNEQKLSYKYGSFDKIFKDGINYLCRKINSKPQNYKTPLINKKNIFCEICCHVM